MHQNTLTKLTGLVVQCDHTMLVDFGHIMDNVLCVYVTLVQNLIKGRNTQNPLQAAT